MKRIIHFIWVKRYWEVYTIVTALLFLWQVYNSIGIKNLSNERFHILENQTQLLKNQIQILKNQNDVLKENYLLSDSISRYLDKHSKEKKIRKRLQE